MCSKIMQHFAQFFFLKVLGRCCLLFPALTYKQAVSYNYLPNKVNCVVHWNSYVPSGLVLNHGFGIMPSCFTHLCGFDDMWSMWI